MAGAESALVLIPRFTSFVGEGEFATAPLDVSAFGSAQIELWRGPLVGSSSGATFRAYLEESLDGVSWQPPSLSAQAHDPGPSASLVLSHIFSLRWFRIRVVLAVTPPGTGKPVVTCWAEGMLR